ISGATIAVLSLPTGLVFSEVQELGNGLYRLNISTTEVNEYQLRFRASAINHLNATAAISLSVTLVPTSFHIEEPLAEYSVEFGSSLEISLHYLELNYLGESVANVSDATIEVSAIGETGLMVLIVPREEYYTIFLSADRIGSWELTISANKSGHISKDIHIEFIVYRVETVINQIDFFVSYIGRTYTLTFYFQYANGSGVTGALPSSTGRGSDLMTVLEVGGGAYNVSFTPDEEGVYTVYFEFAKFGHQLQTSPISFEVDPVPIEIISSTTNWDQTSALVLTATVVEVDTRAPVVDAVVTCELYYGGTMIDEWTLEHIESGVYSGSPTVTWPGTGVIEVVIYVEKDNFQDTSHNVDVFPVPMTPTDYFVVNVLPSLLVFSVLGIVATISYRIARKRQARIRRELSEIKSTFDDAHNLLGILVLHKSSGLPFYSKILKGGFEEGMLSAFVTAVTHFRSEFEESGADKEWKLTPISDIIRAGATRNLICAFVTMRSPSMVHEAKMIMFTREIGLLLDEQMESPPTEFRDDGTSKVIEEMFDDYLDGILVKEYRFSVEGALPRRYRKLSDARSVAGLGDRFTLSELNRGLEALGVEEARGFKLLSEAIEDGQLWPIDKDDEDSILELSG
ncbi:MAG: hypothetical protein ACW98Y_22160, partial [Candidatus Thorarchaeota archaeon]